MKSAVTSGKSPRRRRHKRILGILLITLLVAILATVAVGALLIAPYVGERMDMSLLDLPAVNRPAVLCVRDPSDRVARNGTLSPAPGAPLSPPERRLYVPLSEMPEDLKNAFVAIEDKRFYTHHGVDFLRTGRAALGYLTGTSSFGGSTITQQLVKNLTGEDSPTPDRKLTELFRALDLERHADKDTVLECYLNIINLAEGCRGVGAAARCYFNKEVVDLTLAECATIAAITQNPARYDPLRHPHAARERRDLILREMAAQGRITLAARDAAIASDLVLTPGNFSPTTSQEEDNTAQAVTSWYADLVVSDVIRDLCDRLGYTRARASDLVYTGGLTVETAMDPELQILVENYYTDLSHFPVGDRGRPQSSFILIDPYTGDILAVAGAVGEKCGARVQNYATDTRRPAGSCIKPLSLFAPAIEEGLITWATVLDDAPVTERDGIPWPRNADGLYRGRISAGTALAESVNTTAVRLLERVGEETAFFYLRERFGLTSLRAPTEGQAHDRTISSLALGQQSMGVTSRELTAAYTAFWDGHYRPARSYHRVLDRDGRVLLENPATEGKEVLSPATAALMTRLLETVTDRGTAARYITLTESLGIATAGKTGTTQNNCDRRFVGATPRLLAGVWMGYDYPTELSGISGNPCVRIWDDLITACEQVYRGTPQRLDFDHSVELVRAEFCPLTGASPNPFCSAPEHAPAVGEAVEWGWFIPGTEPQSTCTEHTEPDIPIIPVDPSDPDRIPLLPGDLIPAPSNSQPFLPWGESPETSPDEAGPWFSRWFGRHARRGSE